MSNFKKKLLQVTFPVSLFIYVSLGAILPYCGVCDSSIWYKALPVFLLNIIIPFMLGKIKVSPSVVIVILYVILGLVSQSLGQPLWHPGWVMFFLIPIIEILTRKEGKHTIHVKVERDKANNDDIIDI